MGNLIACVLCTFVTALCKVLKHQDRATKRPRVRSGVSFEARFVEPHDLRNARGQCAWSATVLHPRLSYFQGALLHVREQTKMRSIMMLLDMQKLPYSHGV